MAHKASEDDYAVNKFYNLLTDKIGKRLKTVNIRVFKDSIIFYWSYSAFGFEIEFRGETTVSWFFDNKRTNEEEYGECSYRELERELPPELKYYLSKYCTEWEM